MVIWGRGVESAIRQNDDMELTCIITRRDPKSITPATEGVKVYSVDEIEDLKDQIDVLVLCGGSATDLPKQTPEYAKYFNVIDSFDTHAKSRSILQQLIKWQKKMDMWH